MRFNIPETRQFNPHFRVPEEIRREVEKLLAPKKPQQPADFKSYYYTDKKGYTHSLTPISQYNPHDGSYYTVLDEVLTGNGYRIMPRTSGKYFSYKACVAAIKKRL